MPAVIWLVIVIVAIIASRLVLKEVGKKALAPDPKASFSSTTTDRPCWARRSAAMLPV